MTKLIDHTIKQTETWTTLEEMGKEESAQAGQQRAFAF